MAKRSTDRGHATTSRYAAASGAPFRRLTHGWKTRRSLNEAASKLVCLACKL